MNDPAASATIQALKSAVNNGPLFSDSKRIENVAGPGQEVKIDTTKEARRIYARLVKWIEMDSRPDPKPRLRTTRSSKSTFWLVDWSDEFLLLVVQLQPKTAKIQALTRGYWSQTSWVDTAADSHVNLPWGDELKMDEVDFETAMQVFAHIREVRQTLDNLRDILRDPTAINPSLSGDYADAIVAKDDGGPLFTTYSGPTKCPPFGKKVPLGENPCASDIAQRIFNRFVDWMACKRDRPEPKPKLRCAGVEKTNLWRVDWPDEIFLLLIRIDGGKVQILRRDSTLTSTVWVDSGPDCAGVSPWGAPGKWTSVDEKIVAKLDKRLCEMQRERLVAVKARHQLWWAVR